MVDYLFPRFPENLTDPKEATVTMTATVLIAAKWLSLLLFLLLLLPVAAQGNFISMLQDCNY